MDIPTFLDLNIEEMLLKAIGQLSYVIFFKYKKNLND